MKWLIGVLFWITFAWQSVPGAHYRVDVSNDFGKTWQQLSFGATTSVKLGLPEDQGELYLRLVVIKEGQPDWISPTKVRYNHALPTSVSRGNRLNAVTSETTAAANTAHWHVTGREPEMRINGTCG